MRLRSDHVMRLTNIHDTVCTKYGARLNAQVIYNPGRYSLIQVPDEESVSRYAGVSHVW